MFPWFQRSTHVLSAWEATGASLADEAFVETGAGFAGELDFLSDS
jgi:hypothetical protein